MRAEQNKAPMENASVSEPVAATPPPPQPAAPTLRKKRGPNKVKSSKIMVRSAGDFKIYCHPQKVMIPVSSAVEVAMDRWIEKQIKFGVIKEV